MQVFAAFVILGLCLTCIPVIAALLYGFSFGSKLDPLKYPNISGYVGAATAVGGLLFIANALGYSGREFLPDSILTNRNSSYYFIERGLASISLACIVVVLAAAIVRVLVLLIIGTFNWLFTRRQ